MRFACRITKARIQTHNHNIYDLVLFHGNSGYANSRECYILRTLYVLLIILIADGRVTGGEQRTQPTTRNKRSFHTVTVVLSVSQWWWWRQHLALKYRRSRITMRQIRIRSASIIPLLPQLRRYCG
jgi:hypothetical protein